MIDMDLGPQIEPTARLHAEAKGEVRRLSGLAAP